MANYKAIAPVDYATGKLHKTDKTVFRRKFAHDSNGAVIRPMKREMYIVKNPRDWKLNPAKGAEKLKQERWKEACANTKAILNDPVQRTLWQQRWQAQLRKADPDAPLDLHTGKRRIYIKFDCYVRSKIWRELCQTEKGGS